MPLRRDEMNPHRGHPQVCKNRPVSAMMNRMRLATLAFAAGMVATGVRVSPGPAHAQAADAYLVRAMALHRAAPMIDTHNDLPEMLRERASNDLGRMDPDRPLENIDTDIPRMKQGLVGGQFWSAYVPASFIDKGGATVALEQIDVIRRMVARSPSLGWATTADDIVRVHADGKIASLIG